MKVISAESRVSDAAFPCSCSLSLFFLLGGFCVEVLGPLYVSLLRQECDTIEVGIDAFCESFLFLECTKICSGDYYDMGVMKPRTGLAPVQARSTVKMRKFLCYKWVRREVFLFWSSRLRE